MPKTSLAVVILAFNEEQHIKRAIDSIKWIATEIFVIDSFSTDRTVEIAKESGAIVLQNRWVNYSAQFQWALNNAVISSEWIMRLDADEVVEEELSKEIDDKLMYLNSDAVAVMVRCKQIFWGRWIKHGGVYPLTLLRIWRRGVGRIEQRWMDEHIVLSHGTSVKFSGHLRNENLGDLSFFTKKHNDYATREAVDCIFTQLKLANNSVDEMKNIQAKWKRLIKTHVYNRMPAYLGPVLYYMYRYIFRCGFLDGVEGFVYHTLQGFWYRLLVGARVIELRKAIDAAKGSAKIEMILAQVTGLEIPSSDLSPRIGRTYDLDSHDPGGFHGQGNGSRP